MSIILAKLICLGNHILNVNVYLCVDVEGVEAPCVIYLYLFWSWLNQFIQTKSYPLFPVIIVTGNSITICCGFIEH